jgi:hypothetical protein
MRALAGIVLVLLGALAAQWLVAGDDAALDGTDGVATRDMRRYEIRPGRGIGPIRIGMSRADAERAMGTTGQAVQSFVRGQQGPPVLAIERNSLQAYFDDADRVEGVEIYGGAGDSRALGVEPAFSARYRGVDVFRTPASELVAVVSRDAPSDPAASEDPGVTFEFPSIGLSLWRQTDEQTPFFETVYVSRPRR